MHFIKLYLELFLLNKSQITATWPHWLQVNTGSVNGLVPSGNNPLPVPVFTQIWVMMSSSLGHNELTQYMLEEADIHALLKSLHKEKIWDFYFMGDMADLKKNGRMFLCCRRNKIFLSVAMET